MEKYTDWDQVPLLIGAEDRGKIPLSREKFYELARIFGIKLGKKYVIPKHRLIFFITQEKAPAATEA